MKISKLAQNCYIYEPPQKAKNPVTIAVTGFFVELLGGFEPPTSSLPTANG